MNLIGSHYVLFALPIWAAAILLYAMLNVPIQVLRDYYEGLPYQVSYSAQFGDAALIGVVLIAGTILQRGEALPAWLQDGRYHMFALLLGLAVGIAWVLVDPPSQWGDRYHHLVVVPLLVYMAITLLPVIFGYGTRVEVYAMFFFALLWLGLVVFDFGHKRMAQRPWLQKIGVQFKN